MGALDYPGPERQRLARLSRTWECPLCGKIEDLVPEQQETNTEPSKYADQIAQLHLHGVQEETKKATESPQATATESADDAVVEEDTATTPEEAQQHQSPQPPQVAEEPQPAAVRPATTSFVDSALHYAIVAVIVMILGVLYKKMLMGFGVIPTS